MMSSVFDLLYDELYALAFELKSSFPVFVGGGYGLVLRHRTLNSRNERTLRSIPPARSTEDIDMYLTAEVIADPEKFKMLRDVLLGRGYSGVPGALYYQFERQIDLGGQPRKIKIDLLSHLPESEDILATLKYDERRIRPHRVRKIHAHNSPEAITLSESALDVPLHGPGGDVVVYVLHPFTYLVLKLHAYRDRCKDEDSGFGRHHAFDLYRILAMTTESEWSEAELLRERFIHSGPMSEAFRIVRDLFGHDDARGMIAILEESRSIQFLLSDSDMNSFQRDLMELFPPP